MSHLLRLCAAFLATLALTLQILSAGETAACQVEMEMAQRHQGASSSAPDEGSDTPASAMPGMSDSRASGEHAPCPDEGTRETCVNMAGCVANLIMIPELSIAPGQRVPFRIALVAVDEPLSDFHPPDPPPPRA